MNKVRRTPALVIVALVGIGVVIGRLAPAVIVRFGGNAPQVGWSAAAALLLGAAILGVVAWNTWQSLHKRHQRMTADHGIRMLALAKSGITVGAFVAGVYGGYALAFVDEMDVPLGRERVWHSAAAAAASVVVLVVALLLERACQIPADDDEGKGGGTGRSNGRTDPSPA